MSLAAALCALQQQVYIGGGNELLGTDPELLHKSAGLGSAGRWVFALGKNYFQLDKCTKLGNLVKVDAGSADQKEPADLVYNRTRTIGSIEHSAELLGPVDWSDEIVGCLGSGSIGALVKDELASGRGLAAIAAMVPGFPVSPISKDA